MQHYFDTNRELWNKKTAAHKDSEFYDNEAFMKGKCSLKSFELELMGDVQDLSLLHLQCHFGQDTLSWARRGAKSVGIDLSDKAIALARQMNAELQLNTEFICSNIYDLKQHLHTPFDRVFTSYGTVGWLPDMKKWAEIVAHFLKPNGKFVMVDFHQAMWMFDDQFKTLKYGYFNTGAIEEISEGSYTDRNVPIQNNSFAWNHPLSEILQALIDAGLRIEKIAEYDYSPYGCFDQDMQIETSPGHWQIRGMEGKLPMVYAIRASK